MEEIKEKGTHGGARAGAGRKKKDIGRYIGFNASTQVTAILDSVQGSKADFLNAVVLEYAQRHGLI